MSQGKVEINTRNANYSFGNLHHIFQFVCKRYQKQIASASNILILGFGAGSIYQILRTNHHYQGKIIGVEIDPVMIQLFNRLFNVEDPHLKIVHMDALAYLEELSPDTRFDIIFIDLFIDIQHTEFIQKETFISSVKKHLSESGLILMNTMFPSKQQDVINQMMNTYSRLFKSVQRQAVMDQNQIFTLSDILSLNEA